MLRPAISGVFLLLAIGTLWLAFQPSLGGNISALFLNLGTEVIGIVATVAVVDWVFERRRGLDEAKRMAWDILHGLDHAVWVWQGGRREFDFDELCAVLDQVQTRDPLPPFTQNLLMQLGSRASNTLRNRGDVTRLSNDLKTALEALAPLARVRDHPTLLAASAVQECLFVAAQSLGKVLKLPVPATPQQAAEVDSSPEAQEWRHYGQVLGHRSQKERKAAPKPAKPAKSATSKKTNISEG